MTEEVFTQTIAANAKSLKISPPFLLFSIMSLAENGAAREADIFKPYFKWLSHDMQTKAVKQKRSRKPEVKTSAITALAEMDDGLTGAASSSLFGAASFDLLIGEEKPLKLHYSAWDQLTADRQKVWELATKAGYSSQLDAIQIIKALYPDLVEEAGQFLTPFKENRLDLTI